MSLPSRFKKVKFTKETKFGGPKASTDSSIYRDSMVRLTNSRSRRKEEQWLSAIRALWSAECMAAEAGHGRSWAFAITCKGNKLYWFATLKPTGESVPENEPWFTGLHPLGMLPNEQKSKTERHHGLCWLFPHSLLVNAGSLASQMVHQFLRNNQKESGNAVCKDTCISSSYFQ